MAFADEVEPVDGDPDLAELVVGDLTAGETDQLGREAVALVHRSVRAGADGLAGDDRLIEFRDTDRELVGLANRFVHLHDR